MEPELIDGNLLDQHVEVIVNAWNRNFVPWWLLLPQGVSGAIKKRAGREPFRELAKLGPIPLGGAVMTRAGRLPYRAIIHVAGINFFWRASERSVHDSVISAMGLVREHEFSSVAFPVIGAGSGGLREEQAIHMMKETLRSMEGKAGVIIVRYGRGF